MRDRERRGVGVVGKRCVGCGFLKRGDCGFVGLLFVGLCLVMGLWGWNFGIGG